MTPTQRSLTRVLPPQQTPRPGLRHRRRPLGGRRARPARRPRAGAQRRGGGTLEGAQERRARIVTEMGWLGVRTALDDHALGRSPSRPTRSMRSMPAVTVDAGGRAQDGRIRRELCWSLAGPCGIYWRESSSRRALICDARRGLLASDESSGPDDGRRETCHYNHGSLN